MFNSKKGIDDKVSNKLTTLVPSMEICVSTEL